ncbi:hypothetical protein BDFB_014387 [Asbolus verrucosus]|uniref:Uncharacterized protein n=1 Tax=Asbolus verrucosus TaxID=1661398 RepID=A0A482VBD4_ASBVE|nr:hypothetical protein BDFB_014387 [Asbolus verrucosus]
MLQVKFFIKMTTLRCSKILNQLPISIF